MSQRTNTYLESIVFKLLLSLSPNIINLICISDNIDTRGILMSEKKYPEGKPSKHVTIRIPKALNISVEEFLKTDYAKKMGYLYKVDVITAATRELLEKYSFYKRGEEKE